MTKNKSRQEDEQQEQTNQTRMGKVHVGTLVESIAPEELVSVNDDKCEHTKRVFDPSETEFECYTRANPSCGEVFLYSKK